MLFFKHIRLYLFTSLYIVIYYCVFIYIYTLLYISINLYIISYIIIIINDDDVDDDGLYHPPHSGWSTKKMTRWKCGTLWDQPVHRVFSVSTRCISLKKLVLLPVVWT